MSSHDPKSDLHRYLRTARNTVLWKLDGLSEYDVRRPLVRTGTNLLGLVKHLSGVEAEYFGLVFDRPFPEPLPWMGESAEPNADLWATAGEPTADIVALYRRVWDHADATIADLDLEAVGRVPWWPPDRNEVTLHRILVHVTTETHRHAGHADIVRELIDGAAGLVEGNENLPPGDDDWWAAHYDQVERAARELADRET